MVRWFSAIKFKGTEIVLVTVTHHCCVISKLHNETVDTSGRAVVGVA